ncbi:hypothetical protein [Plebeiibacterium marinum]|uniref:beta-galactosidase n=1 Tax=Plebeiibacterium marinum TaxID=2992111 RepID=A0AAE3SL42_9BACT|nr:hypothetical protein [Plebeiobacterium marinum]MCW3807039.1 hypothetical protein [Plebeiobacterium marinum]
MEKITTVCRDIDPANLGMTSMHDHTLFRTAMVMKAALKNGTAKQGMIKDIDVKKDDSSKGESKGALSVLLKALFSPAMFKNKLDFYVNELIAFKKIGGQSLVDPIPNPGHADMRKVQQLSERSGINIISGTGFYVEPVIPKDLLKGGESAMIDFLSKNVEEGINHSGVKPGVIKSAVSMVRNGKINVDRNRASEILVTGDFFSVLIDRVNGLITSYKAKNDKGEMKELLASGPVPNLFRAPVDGEREALNAKRKSQARNFLLWKESTKERSTSSVTLTEESNKVIVVIKGTMPVRLPKRNKIQKEPLTYQTSYAIYPNGEIELSFDYYFPKFENKAFPYVPEIGSFIMVDGEYNNMLWYGRGPGDTYVNRKYGNDIGIWNNTVDGRAFMYSSPQEMGNSVDAKWLTLTNDDGFGLLVKGMEQFDFNANHYSPEELSKGFDPAFYPSVSNFHPYQLNRSEDIYLRVVDKGTGVGGINSWGKVPLEKYRINASGKSFGFRYIIKPVVKLTKEDFSSF